LVFAEVVEAVFSDADRDAEAFAFGRSPSALGLFAEAAGAAVDSPEAGTTADGGFVPGAVGVGTEAAGLGYLHAAIRRLRSDTHPTVSNAARILTRFDLTEMLPMKPPTRPKIPTAERSRPPSQDVGDRGVNKIVHPFLLESDMPF
jgi:hypothetical protein